MRTAALLAVLLLALVGAMTRSTPTAAAEMLELPVLAPLVAAGTSPPMQQRLPAVPQVVQMDVAGRTPGRYGGTLRMLMSQPKDVRMMVVYGYARLVGYDETWVLVPISLPVFEAEGEP